MPADAQSLFRMAQKLRRHSIESTTEAGSGHPTTCMSSADILSALFFDEMTWDPRDPSGLAQDVFVLSKGHAAPILWAVLKEAGAINDDLLTLRRYDSALEGHPTPHSPWVRVATGSLGQGLCAAAGMAWARKRDGVKGRVFCLMGDGEVAEGSVWEAAQFAAFYALDHLVAIVDVNRLGQSGPTMLQHDMATYEARFRAFGWEAVVVDGHDIPAVQKAFAEAQKSKGKPVAILAKTHKGRGVSFVEDKEGWHGRPFKKGEEMQKALAELGDTTIEMKVEPRRYSDSPTRSIRQPKVNPKYTLGQEVATREAYGTALAQIGADCLDVVALDGDTKNSTFAEKFKEIAPDRFADAYIAEQNMVGAALGMATEGKIPFASTFACFMGRAYDFIRMAALSKPKHLVLCGSHAGVSIGEDGASQMALEDIAMMRAIIGATVLYPSDAVSTERLIEAAARTPGIVYIRTSRPKTKVLYGNDEYFPVGQSKTLRSSKADRATVVGAGVTVHEALAAHDILAKEGIAIRVIDLYSVKPLDEETLRLAATETKHVISVEDHAVWGGIGEGVSAAVGGLCPVTIVGVHDTPRSGKPSELMHAHGLDAASIAATVRSVLK